MSEKCVLDEDNCLSLESISRAFRCGVKEEHTWALVYQSIISLKEDLNQNQNNSFVETTDLYIRNNGTIDPKSWHSLTLRSGFMSNKQIVSSIGKVVYKALDYGTNEDEEVVISSLLESVFDLIIQDFTEDEGIEDETEDSDLLLDEVLDKCKTRIIDNADIGEHYRNVCRALVAEAIDISTFLHQISIGTKELKKINNVDNDDVDCLQREVWVHIWMKVMRQLRNGVQLKSIDRNELINRQQREYELTPFEMLLDDINSKRYSLKKVVSVPKEVEKDAQTMILDFIRSRPPLKPVSERRLSPLPPKEPTLHERLMYGIKAPKHLKPTPRPFERKYDSFHLQRGERYRISNRPLDKCKEAVEPTENIFRRFSFRNLSLRGSSAQRKPVIKIDSIIERTITTTPTANTSRVTSLWRKLSFW